MAFGGTVAGWNNTGAGAMHAVDRVKPGGQANRSDWAIMIWQDNVIISEALAANTAGRTYRVNFEVSAAVYAMENQATKDGDALLIEVLRGDNSVLASDTISPGHGPGRWSLPLRASSMKAMVRATCASASGRPVH